MPRPHGFASSCCPSSLSPCPRRPREPSTPKPPQGRSAAALPCALGSTFGAPSGRPGRCGRGGPPGQQLACSANGARKPLRSCAGPMVSAAPGAALPGSSENHPPRFSLSSRHCLVGAGGRLSPPFGSHPVFWLVLLPLKPRALGGKQGRGKPSHARVAGPLLAPLLRGVAHPPRSAGGRHSGGRAARLPPLRPRSPFYHIFLPRYTNSYLFKSANFFI